MGGGYEAYGGHQNNINSYSLMKDINYNLDGEGVDIIIWEGDSNMFTANNDGIEYNHPETRQKR